jgi:hypothetical protein
MRKMIVLVVVSVVCLVLVNGAIAQPNKFWAMDVGNSWTLSGSNPIDCGGPCIWTWRTTIGAIDQTTVPGFTTFRFDGFDGGTVLEQREWYSVNPLDPFDLRWHRNEDFVDQIVVTVDAGLLIGIKPIAPGLVINETTAATFNGSPIGVNSTTTVVGFGPVAVPLGTFQAYEVRLVVTTNPNVGGIDRTRWFAPYIGVVKDMEVLLPNPSNIDTEVLTDLNIATVFSDVPVKLGPGVNPFYQYVMAIYDDGITTGCIPGAYCPVNNVTRDQMASFLVRAVDGANATVCSGGVFTDVNASNPHCANIERLMALNITAGCGPTSYCPGDSVTRNQMAAFIVRAVSGGPNFEGPCAGPSSFTDVLQSSVFCANIQQLVNLGVTGGCGAGIYCPGFAVTREQMAAFLARAFLNLQ